jgi:DNA-binding transcriptional MerR regulator
MTGDETRLPDSHEDSHEQDLGDPVTGESEEGHSRLSGKSVSAFRTISEVSAELDVPQHVLRFWESKFTQLRPLKRGGGRRYYRPEDLALLRRIHGLLYREGYTIKGVQRVLRAPRGVAKEETAAEAVKPEAPRVQVEATLPGIPKPASSKAEVLLRELLNELKTLRALLD